MLHVSIVKVTSGSRVFFSLGEVGETTVSAFWSDLLASASSLVSGLG